jgi:hypothetical protein
MAKLYYNRPPVVRQVSASKRRAVGFDRSSHTSFFSPGGASPLDFSAVGGPKPPGAVKHVLHRLHALLIGR